MKYWRLFLLIIIFQASVIVKAQENQETNPVKIMTYNIRWDNPDDGENIWENRKKLVAELIKNEKPDIIGLQEALYNQICDLLDYLPEYDFCGVGRLDGKQKGEYAAILFLKERFKIIDKSNFWLSKTPDIPGSKSWDAACERIVSYAKIFDKYSEKEFLFFNTHFDHIGKRARKKSAKLLLDSISEISKELPVILTGDFNCKKNSRAYHKIVNSKKIKLFDAKNISENKVTNPDYTYVGFDFIGEKGDVIDYIFVSPKVRVINSKIITTNIDGRYASDHLPVTSLIFL